MDKLGRLRTELGTQIFCINAVIVIIIKYLIEAHKKSNNIIEMYCLSNANRTCSIMDECKNLILSRNDYGNVPWTMCISIGTVKI